MSRWSIGPIRVFRTVRQSTNHAQQAVHPEAASCGGPGYHFWDHCSSPRRHSVVSFEDITGPPVRSINSPPVQKQIHMGRTTKKRVSASVLLFFLPRSVFSATANLFIDLTRGIRDIHKTDVMVGHGRTAPVPETAAWPLKLAASKWTACCAWVYGWANCPKSPYWPYKQTIWTCVFWGVLIPNVTLCPPHIYSASLRPVSGVVRKTSPGSILDQM
jgi:hypothetical protein